MFNLDNSSAGIDRRSIQIDRKGNKPMAPRRIKTGQGFSLFDLKDVISDVTETLAAALNKQGVDVSTDQLFLQLQNLVQSVGSSNGYVDSGYGGVLSASDKVPYSVAGDLLVIAYENYKNGDRKEALKNMLAAMSEDDFSAIANGIFLMNKKGDASLLADESDENTETDNTEEDSDIEDTDDTGSTDDDSDEDDTDDLEDSDIDSILDETDDETATESTASDNDNGGESTDNDNDDTNSDDTNEEETENTTDNKGSTDEDSPGKKPTPMGKTSSEMTASHTSKVLANRLSLDGSAINRARAREFLKKNSNL